MEIKKLESSELRGALNLVRKVFLEFEAPDYSEQGTEEFFKSVYDENYLSMLTAFGAWHDDELVGIIATRNQGSHIALFFVDGKYQRQGIGRQLFQTVLENCSSEKMTVNSSPYAVEIYHKLGFYDTGKEQIINGIRFTPMERNNA
ncbi:MAG: GNAT family N-acetyltransferase [Oscillospiraceae bacterium]